MATTGNIAPTRLGAAVTPACATAGRRSNLRARVVATSGRFGPRLRDSEHATAYLVERGLDVTGVDVSARSIDTARAEVPGARFTVGDMASLDLPGGSFDLFIAFYSTVHVPRDEHAPLLCRVASWLRPGGFMAAMGGGVGAVEQRAEAWLGVAPRC
jgi:SAM-dependent methyltransferase